MSFYCSVAFIMAFIMVSDEVIHADKVMRVALRHPSSWEHFLF